MKITIETEKNDTLMQKATAYAIKRLKIFYEIPLNIVGRQEAEQAIVDAYMAGYNENNQRIS